MRSRSSWLRERIRRERQELREIEEAAARWAECLNEAARADFAAGNVGHAVRSTTARTELRRCRAGEEEWRKRLEEERPVRLARINAWEEVLSAFGWAHDADGDSAGA